jgi:DNA-binding NarL/FixJ family response regulator
MREGGRIFLGGLYPQLLCGHRPNPLARPFKSAARVTLCVPPIDMQTKLLIVDDHPMLLNGLRQALSEHSNLTLAGETATGEEALNLARKLTPDLVVMDIHLPDLNGIEATRKILKAQPSIKVLIFTRDPNRKLVQEALQAGASGYVLKTGKVEELIHAIEEVMAGNLYLSAEVSAEIVEDYQKTLTGKVDSSKPVLSKREKQLLRLIAMGLRNKEIASELKLSPNSIETYRARLMKKVGYRNTAELVRFAIREGIAPL